jgi:hypothetical protein
MKCLFAAFAAAILVAVYFGHYLARIAEVGLLIALAWAVLSALAACAFRRAVTSPHKRRVLRQEHDASRALARLDKQLDDIDVERITNAYMTKGK